jgi:hypothetical protein
MGRSSLDATNAWRRCAARAIWRELAGFPWCFDDGELDAVELCAEDFFDEVFFFFFCCESEGACDDAA